MNILEKINKSEIEKTQIKKLTKGEILYSEGDVCEYIGIIKSGHLQIVSYLEDGKEIIYNDLDKNKIFGNNLIFSSNPFYRGDIIAKQDTEVCLISKKVLLELFKENQDFLVAYLEEQSNFGKQLNLKIKLLTFTNVKDRILYFLSINKNTIKYKSITDLANKLFLSRESVSRELHKLANEKIIKISGKEIVKI